MKALRSQFCIRSQLLLGVMMAALHGQALADTSITEGTNKQYTTSVDGNITVNSGVVLNFAGTGPTITMDSPLGYSVLNTDGTIENLAANNGIAIQLNGGASGELTIDDSGTSLVNVSGNNSFGVLVTGNGTSPFTGDIDFESTSLLIVTGNHSVGIDVAGPMVGNVIFNSTNTIYGNGTIGLLTTAQVTGEVQIGGTLEVFAEAPASYNASILNNPLSDSAVLIGANVTGGIQVTSGAAIENRSTLPAMVVAPSVAGLTAGTLVLGSSDGLGSVNVSFVNSGAIEAPEGVVTDTTTRPGISTIGLLLGETAAGNNGTTVLPGGFYNGGTIAASARTDTFTSDIGAANATALEIGNGTTINAFLRTGMVGNGSTNSTIVLDPGASPYDDEYNGLTITLLNDPTDGNVTRTVNCYTGGNQTVIVASDPSGACTPLQAGTSIYSLAAPPTAGDQYTLSGGEPLINSGSIEASNEGVKGGVVYGIHIMSGANVVGLENTGTIEASASGILQAGTTIAALQAYAIRDDSGTLNTILNYGAITGSAVMYGNSTVQAEPLTGGAQQSVAIDISHTSNPESITVSSLSSSSTTTGTITGDVQFGSAPGNATTSGNLLTIDGSITNGNGTVSVSTVTGAVSAAAGGTLDIEISNTGGINDGGALATDNTQATTLAVGQNGQVDVTLSKTSTPATPAVDITGNATFASGSAVVIVPSTFLTNGTANTPLSTSTPTTFVLIKAGNLSVSPSVFSSNSVPYMLSGTITQNGNELDLTVQRKTGQQLGLTGNSLAIYNSLSAAVLNDDTFGAVLLSLTTDDQVKAAVASALPDVSGGVREMAIAMTDQATGVIGARQRQLITSADPADNEFRFWAQEFYNNANDPGTSTVTGYNGAGQGLALGGEWGALSKGRYGVAYTFYSSEEEQRPPVDTKTDSNWNMASAYAGWRMQNVFVTPEVSVGEGSFLGQRTVSAAGNVTTTAQTATAAFSGYIAAGGVSTGYIFNFGAFQIIPELSFDAMYLHQSGYNEVGATGLDLSMAPQNQESLRGFAGVIGQANFQFADANLTPRILAGWSHEFDNNPQTIDGSFEATPGSQFSLTGAPIDADHVVGGASFNYVTHYWQAGLNVDAQVGARTTEEAATVNISSRF